MNLAELRATLIEWLDEFMSWPSHTQQNWSDYIMTDSEWGNYRCPERGCGTTITTPPELKSNVDRDDEKRMHLHVFTDEHEYHLSIYICDDGKVGMMGFAQSRKPRAGENWLRGNDFTEGEFSQETLKRFFLDIGRWEIVAKVKKRENTPEVVDTGIEIPPASKTPLGA